MMVHLDTAFPAFEGILRSPDQIITLSAILLIPHNRRMAKRASAFSAEVVPIIVEFHVAHPRLIFHAFAASLVVVWRTSALRRIRRSGSSR